MQVLEAAVAANPWPLRRERAAELAERYPHAEEMLRLYQALTLVQEPAVQIPPQLSPSPSGGGQGGGAYDIADIAAQQILPGIVDVTVEMGPRALRDGVINVFSTADLTGLVQRWLDHQPLDPFETYLARASASPLLEALSVSPSPLAGEGKVGGGIICIPASWTTLRAW